MARNVNVKGAFGEVSGGNEEERVLITKLWRTGLNRVLWNVKAEL